VLGAREAHAGARPDEAPQIVVGPRIGITRAVDLPWRFCAAGSRFVSKPWPPGLLAPVSPRGR